MFLQWFLADEESENKFLQVVEKLLLNSKTQPVKAFLKLVPYSTICNVNISEDNSLSCNCYLSDRKAYPSYIYITFQQTPYYMTTDKNAVQGQLNFQHEY